MESFSEKLEEYCKNLSTVIEYFLIIGLSSADIHRNFEEGDKFSPSILSQFPTFNRNDILIPESIPLFCFPWGVNISKKHGSPIISYLVLTDEKGNKLYCTCMKILELKEEISEEISEEMSKETELTAESKNNFFIYIESFYIPKCLVIISRLAFFETFDKILSKLYSLCYQKSFIPMEWYICHLAISIPTPPRGHLTVEYSIDSFKCNFQLPPCNKLPLLDINLGHLFSSLSLENILKVFTALILENSVVFLSNDQHKLSACSYSFLSLLFPFYWSLVYVPILPELLLDYLYSPVSYVYGLNIQSKEEACIRANENLIIIDLDHDIVQTNAQAFKLSNESAIPTSLPNLPLHYSKKLINRLIEIIENLEDFSFYAFEKAAEMIRDSFFQFFVSILKNYKKYMNFVVDNGMGCFDDVGFLKSCPEDSKPFFNVFLKTQMFANFCETRLRPQNVEEHSENLLFDEHILAKENRSKLKYNKSPTPFIIDDSQQIKDKWHVNEIKISPDFEGITYNCFPEINSNTLNQFQLPRTHPPKYSESFDFPFQNNSALLQKYHSDKECIYICWLEMWAACLWYQDEIEHNLRLKELISTLKKLKESNSFSLTSIYKLLLGTTARNDPSLGLPIFSEMTTSMVMVDAATIHLLQRNISLSFKKDQQNVRNTRNSIFFTNTSSVDSLIPNIYRKRVFTKMGDTNIFAKQDLCFLIKETCKNCKKFLNVKEIKEGWSNTETDFESFCIGCKEKFTPSIKIRIGLEIGHKIKTSNKESTIFLSPVALRGLVRYLLEDPKNKFQLDIELFRVYNSIIFWNLIWHFNDNCLPFEFMLPYEKEVLNVRSSFVIVGEEISQKKYVDKEVQTDWNIINIDKALKQLHEK